MVLPRLPSTLEISATVALASEVPVNVGVVSLVVLSVLELPESLAALKSGTEGAEGAVVSTVKLVKASALLALPSASVTVMVQSLYVPSANAVLLSLWVKVMVAVPVTTAPSDALPQLPPTDRVPDSSVVTNTFGVESAVGVVTAVSSLSVGAILSTKTEAKLPTEFKVVERSLPAPSFRVPLLRLMDAPRAMPSESESPLSTV